MCSEILKQKKTKTKKIIFFNEMKLKKNLFVIEGAAKIGVIFFPSERLLSNQRLSFSRCPCLVFQYFKSSAFVIGAAVNLARAKIVQERNRVEVPLRQSHVR